MTKILRIICGIVLILFISPESYSLVMGPDKLELVLPVGGKFVTDYYIQNDTDEPLHVKAEAENWFLDVYNYSELKIENWIKIEPAEFDLNPKEIKKTKLYIDVPTKIKGEVAAQIFFSSDLKGTMGGGKASVTARLGGVLYVAIKGTEKVKAEISRINVSKVTEDGKEKLKIEATLKNNGNVHLRPTGNVVIINEKGEKAAAVDLMTGYSVLPTQDYIFSAFLEKPDLRAGKYTITVSMDYGKLYEMKKVASLKKKMDVNNNGEIVLK